MNQRKSTESTESLKRKSELPQLQLENQTQPCDSGDVGIAANFELEHIPEIAQALAQSLLDRQESIKLLKSSRSQCEEMEQRRAEVIIFLHRFD